MYQGLQAVRRCMLVDDVFRDLVTSNYRADSAQVGPAGRLRQLLRTPLAPHVEALMVTPTLDKQAWLHALREIWRHSLLCQASSSRPDHFGGIEHVIATVV
eukprot:5902509-Amphidinium_carterae.1